MLIKLQQKKMKKMKQPEQEIIKNLAPVEAEASQNAEEWEELDDADLMAIAGGLRLNANVEVDSER